MIRLDARPGMRAAWLALAAVAATLPAAHADAIAPSYQYETGSPQLIPSTSGDMSVLGFQGVTSGSLGLNNSFSLGDLVVNPGSGTTTYQDTPFYIMLELPQFDQTTPLGSPNPGPIYTSYAHQINDVILQGHIDGTVGPSGTNLTVTFDSVKSGDPEWWLEIPEDKYNFTFPFPTSGVKLPGPITLTAGPGATSFNLSAEIDGTPVPIPAPEPGSLALFAASAGYMALWLRRRAGSAAQGPNDQASPSDSR